MNRNRTLWVALLGAITLSAVGLVLWAKPAGHSRSQETRPSALSSPRLLGQTSTVLPDGEVLLLGGQGMEGPVATSGVEDPRTGGATQVHVPMLRSRAWHTATLLPDGTVLIFGGVGADGHLVKNAE